MSEVIGSNPTLGRSMFHKFCTITIVSFINCFFSKSKCKLDVIRTHKSSQFSYERPASRNFNNCQNWNMNIPKISFLRIHSHRKRHCHFDGKSPTTSRKQITNVCLCPAAFVGDFSYWPNKSRVTKTKWERPNVSLHKWPFTLSPCNLRPRIYLGRFRICLFPTCG